MNKIAFVTGISGQDGYYLSKFLLEKNYVVHGTIRRSSLINTERIDSLISKYKDEGKLFLHYSDLLDPSSLNQLIQKIQPDEVYNLAAQSHVAVSFKNPVFSTQTGTLGPLSILEAVKNSGKNIKYYQASSSEMFGGINSEKLNEKSKFIPKSPYAASKVFAHHITTIYRESYELFAVNGILFNHESPFRGETFVTRKITRALGRIYHGLQTKLTLGNLDSYRDWGFAGDYVKGMWMMMNHHTPDDWVLATGEAHSVREFLEVAFSQLDLNYHDYVISSEKYYRPNEVNHLLGDYSKAKTELGWEPETSFEDLIKIMIENDLKLAEREKTLIEKNLLLPTWEHSL